MYIQLVNRKHLARDDVERLIRSVYARRYSAWLTRLPEQLAAVFSDDGKPVCAAGIRPASSGFFSECYLDWPVEDCIATRLGKSVDRRRVLEITNLAGSGGFVRALLAFINDYGVRRGMQWGLCTVTPAVGRQLELSASTLLDLGAAVASRASKPMAWGNYYKHEPRVCVVSISAKNPVATVISGLKRRTA